MKRLSLTDKLIIAELKSLSVQQNAKEVPRTTIDSRSFGKFLIRQIGCLGKNLQQNFAMESLVSFFLFVWKKQDSFIPISGVIHRYLQ